MTARICTPYSAPMVIAAERRIGNWPQLLAALAISAIRAKAGKALGSKFDIRAFHDELLNDGALPMSVLQAKMERWITTSAR